MKLFARGKDGGPESKVWGYWLIEAKGLCSIALLRFEDGSRDTYHDHAFNAISWLIKGELDEQFLDGKGHILQPSWKPIITKKTTFHQVKSRGRSWAITFRGPWENQWHEWLPNLKKHLTLTTGRKVVS
jgi:hypothetical protein